jgi:3-phenylpropionate/trans-cinnamate dioxygenase ferredoxin reductase subunit
LPADLVVVAVGVIPDVTLAAEAGLAVADGIVVDEYLRTEDPNIFAIGDCANFPCLHAGRATRLESVQNAVDQARAVAASIVGEGAPYDSLPWFWTDQAGAKLQIAGILANADQTVVTGNRPHDHIAARRLFTVDHKPRYADLEASSFDLKAHVQSRSTG